MTDANGIAQQAGPDGVRAAFDQAVMESLPAGRPNGAGREQRPRSRGEPDRDRPAPPENLEAERAILGLLLQRGSAMFDRVAAILRPEHFVSAAHTAIYQGASRLIERGAHPDVVALGAALKGDPDVAQVGGGAYLSELKSMAGDIVPGASVELWAQNVREMWQRRRAIAVADEIAAAAYRPGDGVIEDAMAACQRGLDEISAGGDPDSAQHISVYYQEAIEAAEAARKRGGKIVGVTTGLRDLDECIGGLQGGDLIIPGARPGMGKSSLGGSIAMTAARAGATVIVYSLEMPGVQVGGRALAIDTGIPYAKLRSGKIDREEDWSRLLDAKAKAEGLPIFVDPTPAIRPSQIASRARRIKRRHGLGLIIVDYLQLMRGDTNRRDGSKVLEVAEITGALKAMAKEMNVPVVAFSQLNRQVEQREDKRPMLSDLRDSGSIEQDADIVMFLFREEYYLQKEGEPKRRTGEDVAKFNDRYRDWNARFAKSRGVGEIIVAKQRNGPEKTIRAHFDAELMTYTDLYEDDPHGAD